MAHRSPFIDLLRRRWVEADSLLCVGLDPDPSRLPASLAGDTGVYDFCTAIVDATADLVCAFKPQAAYFAAYGRESVLARVIDYIRNRHPQVPVILDAKRGDIGDTARLYAVEAFERFGADAVTVNPYLGRESIEPYLEYPERGVIVLCRTSNEGSGWLQHYAAQDGAEPLYLRVASAVADWNVHGNLMLVAGATYVDDLSRIRERVGDMPLLVPGVGAQGGDLAAALAAGADSTGSGLAINASRSVLFAGAGRAFAEDARRAAEALRDDIRRCQLRLRPVRPPA